MSKIYLNSTFMHRADTAENWSAANPVLKNGEVGVELGSPAALKTGDGVTPWNSLEYTAKNELKQDKFAEVAETDTSDGKKRTTLTGETGHYITVKSKESISVEGRGIELRPANGCLKLNSGNGSGKVKVQNVAEPTVSTEAATKNYVDSSLSDKQDKFAEVTEASNKATLKINSSGTMNQLVLRNSMGHNIQLRGLTVGEYGDTAATKQYVDEKVSNTAPTSLSLEGVYKDSEGNQLSTFTAQGLRIGNVLYIRHSEYTNNPAIKQVLIHFPPLENGFSTPFLYPPIFYNNYTELRSNDNAHVALGGYTQTSASDKWFIWTLNVPRSENTSLDIEIAVPFT